MNVRIVGALAALLASTGAALAQPPAPGLIPGPPPAGPPVASMPAPPVTTAPPVALPGGDLFPPAAPPAAPTLSPEALAPAMGSNACYAEADYILWRVRGFNIPTGVSPQPAIISPFTVTSLATFGPVLSSGPSAMNGARVTLGAWGNPNHSLGIEGSAFILERGNNTLAADATSADGTVTARALLNTSTSLYGGEVNARGVCLKVGSLDVGWLAGGRYIAFADSLRNQTDIRVVGLAPPLGSDLTFSTSDRLRFYNNFIGAQLGMDAAFSFGGFYLSSRLKVSGGPTFQKADLDAFTQVANRGPAGLFPNSVRVPGGLLVSPVDVREHKRTVFSFIPEVNLRLGYAFTDWFRGHIGYDALYLNHMARPGLFPTTNTLNATVSGAGVNAAATTSDSSFRFRDHDVWVRGFNCGFELLF